MILQRSPAHSPLAPQPAQPSLSIIIPAREPSEAADLLKTLHQLQPLDQSWQILLAFGTNPSRQRNEAAARALAPTLWFLDADCQPDTSLIEKILHEIRDASCEVCGGPVELKSLESAPLMARAIQALLGCPILFGRIASRYRAHGQRRSTDEKELILCHLLVSRQTYATSGGFHEELYPNEENEWLGRLTTDRPDEVRLIHDPSLRIHRPQRTTFPAFLLMMYRYGQGRMRQTWISRRPDPNNLALLFLPGCLAALALLPSLWLFGWITGTLAAALVVKKSQPLTSFLTALLAGGLFLPGVLAYSAGGWSAFLPFKKLPTSNAPPIVIQELPPNSRGRDGAPPPSNSS